MEISDLFTSFSLGLLATTSPCLLPLYPGFLAYLSASQPNAGKRPLLGLFVLLGVLTMMVALGFAFSLLSLSIGNALSVLVPLSDGLLLLLGVLLLLGRNPFKRLPQIHSPLVSHPLVNAFLYGLLYGPIALPCSGPLVLGIFAFSISAAEVSSKLLLFLVFGLGFGSPLLALSFLSRAVQRRLTRSVSIHARWVNLATGVLMIGVAVYDLRVNWLVIWG